MSSGKYAVRRVVHLFQVPLFELKFSIPAIATLFSSIVASGAIAPINAAVPPANLLLAQTLTQTNPPQPSDNSGNASSSPSPPTAKPPAKPESKPESKPRDDDRVNIDEIYPEYCRSYFFNRDSVSLFEYREGMYRCFHGVDQWRR